MTVPLFPAVRCRAPEVRRRAGLQARAPARPVRAGARASGTRGLRVALRPQRAVAPRARRAGPGALARRGGRVRHPGTALARRRRHRARRVPDLVRQAGRTSTHPRPDPPQVASTPRQAKRTQGSWLSLRWLSLRLPGLRSALSYGWGRAVIWLPCLLATATSATAPATKSTVSTMPI